MNSETRSETIETLMDLSQHYPDWRLGQLLANVAGWADRPIWEIDDDELLDAACQHLERAAQKSVLVEQGV